MQPHMVLEVKYNAWRYASINAQQRHDASQPQAGPAIRDANYRLDRIR